MQRLAAQPSRCQSVRGLSSTGPERSAQEQRDQFEIEPAGLIVEWPELDEQIGVLDVSLERRGG